MNNQIKGTDSIEQHWPCPIKWCEVKMNRTPRNPKNQPFCFVFVFLFLSVYIRVHSRNTQVKAPRPGLQSAEQHLYRPPAQQVAAPLEKGRPRAWAQWLRLCGWDATGSGQLTEIRGWNLRCKPQVTFFFYLLKYFCICHGSKVDISITSVIEGQKNPTQVDC